MRPLFRPGRASRRIAAGVLAATALSPLRTSAALPIRSPACGPSWSIVPSRDPSDFRNDLNAVTAISDTDAWAVGARVIPAVDNYGRTLIEHWDGTSWMVIRSPNAGGFRWTHTLKGVSGVASNDVWAVGFYTPP